MVLNMKIQGNQDNISNNNIKSLLHCVTINSWFYFKSSSFTLLPEWAIRFLFNEKVNTLRH